MNNLFSFSGILFFGAIFILISQVTGEPLGDKQALLDFLNNVTHSRNLVWNASSPVCTTWFGVTCNKDQTGVISLRLPGMSLRGSIPPNTLSRLSQLQILSLRSNGLQGSFPADFSALKSLTFLYLQSNRFSGPLPSDFSVWKNLSVLDLSNNGFNGTIPPSISNVTRLVTLNLANNLLTGEIPDLGQSSLQHLNLSNNNLTGAVPKSLQRFPSSAFSGNNLTSETALPPALPPALPLQPPSRGVNLNEPEILGIAIGGCVFLFVLIALFMIICYVKKEKDEKSEGKLPVKKEASTKTKGIDLDKSHDEENNKMVFFEGSNLAFNLEDLLRASAEVLGKGTFGITYKAVLEDASIVAVKRLKDLNVSKKDFEQQMEIVGNIKHENVTPLRAYCSKDEKLMVYDYYSQGSLSALLHANRGESRNPLDWKARMKFAIGAARGIAHIHTQSGGKLAHGNIKSSNIFLNSKGYGCVSDTGLATLSNPTHPPVTRGPGYRAPEVTDTRKATHASDVYSFGVLLLEILTGKSPLGNNEDVVHLVRWVNSVVREEWTAEVFDIELLRYPNIEEEMIEMLHIGIACTQRVPEKRPKMQDVVRMVEEIRLQRPKSEILSEASSNSAATPLSSVAGPSNVPK